MDMIVGFAEVWDKWCILESGCHLCAQADPSPDLVVVALDETGTRLPAVAQEPQPSMKTSRGWVSSTRIQFQTGPGVKRVEVQCTAINAMGEATTSVATQMQCKFRGHARKASKGLTNSLLRSPRDS